MAPLGCDTKGRKITFNEAEAERVRAIFRTYLKLGSLNLLMADLRKRNIVTKFRSLKTGQTVGGIPFTRGSLARLLRNRFYVGGGRIQHTSNRSLACRNGNWKMVSRDWRHEATSPDRKFQNLLTRDCGAPA
jgi:hypothetical protein